MKYHEFKVRVPHLQGVSIADWKAYIDDAVRAWCGQYGGDVGNPREVMGRHSDAMRRVKVTRIMPKPRKKLRYVPPVPGVDDLLTKEERDALRERNCDCGAEPGEGHAAGCPHDPYDSTENEG